MAFQAYVTPGLLRWARERDRKSPQEAADRLKIRPERLEEWETGRARPTFRQAQELAAQFHVPFGYLFLDAPPTERLPLPDLRTIAGQPAGLPSPELMDAVEDALEKQSWLREYREEEGAAPLPFVGRAALTDEVAVVAADIRTTIGLDDELRESVDRVAGFLRVLVAAVERAGVLVMRNGVVANNTHRRLRVQEFRGFAASDPLAPLVFINAADALAAQIFTLIHELVHIWLNLSGISNPQIGGEPAQDTDGSAIERFCNRVAAETLIPHEELSAHWQHNVSVLGNVGALSKRYWVSRAAILRHASDLELISRQDYHGAYPAVTGQQPERGGGGGDFYRSLITRNSKVFTETLLTAVAEGRVLHRDAARMLHVGVDRLDSVASRVFSSQAELGA
jgi:Zn-dependent peptidase ImmA (M78 family)